jgi:hypothetical protein
VTSRFCSANTILHSNENKPQFNATFPLAELNKMRGCAVLLQVLSMLQIIFSETPRGHLKPLGEHRPPEIETEKIIGDLHPIDFWKKYVKPGIPLLFPGAAKSSQ